MLTRHADANIRAKVCNLLGNMCRCVCVCVRACVCVCVCAPCMHTNTTTRHGVRHKATAKCVGFTDHDGPPWSLCVSERVVTPVSS